MQVVSPAPPRVSVIVRTKDRPRLLAQALDSLRAQTMTDFETLVINDGRPLDAPLLEPAPGRGLTLLQTEPPKGRARALNTGLKAASGRYVAYLDDDDLFLPDHLETLARFLDGSDEYRVAYTDVDQREQILAEDGSYRDAGRRIVYGRPFDPSRLLSSNYIPLIGLMHQRALVDTVGLFDESFDLFEDWDFLIRLSAASRFRHIPKITAVYRVRDDATNAISRFPWLGPEAQVARRRLFAKHWTRRWPENEMALVDGFEKELQDARGELGRVQEAFAESNRARDAAEGRLASRDEELRETARKLEAAGSREAALKEENTRLGAVLEQVRRSLLWRLLTPWWKLKGLRGR